MVWASSMGGSSGSVGGISAFVDGLAQVGGHHVGARHDFGRRPFGQDFSLIENDDAVAQRHDRAHDVLDEQDGGALRAYALYQGHGFVDLGGRKARQHFIEHQQLGLGG